MAEKKEEKHNSARFFDGLVKDAAGLDKIERQTVTNPFAIDDAGANVRVGSLGDIPLVSVYSSSNTPVNSPGALRTTETNATLVGLSSRQERKQFYMQEIMRDQWSKTKNAALLKWLKSLASSEPEKLVVKMDGGNVLYGGCKEKDIKIFYNAIVKASGGAPVVGGAEV